MQATDPTRCEATAASGERCRKRAVRGRLCLVHAGVQSMVELGRKGGQVSPQTRLRKAADDDLRELARDTLAKALRGEDVDKQQLDAARSLFSYRADSPPAAERQDFPNSQPQLADGRPVTSLADVIRFGLEINALSPAVVEACRQVVASSATPAKGS
jgi:hypothetical protein